MGIRVCEKFQLPLAIMEHVKSKDVHNWEAVLSDTEIRCLGLIRALIANPEVLCIQKPTQLFDEKTAMRVHKLVREFIDNKGLAVSKPGQRPRTCICTLANRKTIINVARDGIMDKIYCISASQIRLVPREDVDAVDIVGGV